MKALVENYKGIEFVRLSTLPEDQKGMIWASAYKDKVIKILRGGELLNDCLSYENYAAWYKQFYEDLPSPTAKPVERAKELKLAFK